MVRSRSSFDLSSAITTAVSLAPPAPEEKSDRFHGVALISFSPPQVLPDENTARPPPPPPRAPAPEPSLEELGAASESPRRPPKLPDLSALASPVARCEKIVDWVAEATGASEVFLADGSGLPIAGAVHEAEARLAGSGLVAHSVASLAGSIPGNSSPLFELHVGEGPYFQLIGFQVAGALYLVGFLRPQPLSPRQVHAIRLACRHALGESPGAHA